MLHSSESRETEKASPNVLTCAAVWTSGIFSVCVLHLTPLKLRDQAELTDPEKNKLNYYIYCLFTVIFAKCNIISDTLGYPLLEPSPYRGGEVCVSL